MNLFGKCSVLILLHNNLIPSSHKHARLQPDTDVETGRASIGNSSRTELGLHMGRLVCGGSGNYESTETKTSLNITTSHFTSNTKTQSRFIRLSNTPTISTIIVSSHHLRPTLSWLKHLWDLGKLLFWYCDL